MYICTDHCDLKVSSSQAKIDENFANYFLKPKLYSAKIYMLRATEKYGLLRAVRSKPRYTSNLNLPLKLMILCISRLNLCDAVLYPINASASINATKIFEKM